jgi:REP element-mobilizing transposase RayT
LQYNPQIHHRRSIRLKGYDYARPGYYFVTLNVQHRERLFGEIVNSTMALNTFGKIIEYHWKKMPSHSKNMELDVFQIMPDHFHAIVHIVDMGDDGERAMDADAGNRMRAGNDADVGVMDAAAGKRTRAGNDALAGAKHSIQVERNTSSILPENASPRQQPTPEQPSSGRLFAGNSSSHPPSSVEKTPPRHNAGIVRCDYAEFSIDHVAENKSHSQNAGGAFVAARLLRTHRLG